MSKFRSDFIINSSSSCFVITKNKHHIITKDLTVDKLKKILSIMLKCHNDIYSENKKYEEVFGYVDTPDKEKSKNAFEESYWDGNSFIDCIDEDDFDDSNRITYLDEVMKNDFVIFSKDDNTIPWDVRNNIETVLNATRYHLG